MATTRLAQTTDLDALRTLDPWPSEKSWHRLIGNGEAMVLEIDGQVVGMLHFAVLWATVPFLCQIEIAEAHRGKGHSRQMIGALADHLRAEGYVALLSSSQTDEPEPQAWHVHLGFTSNGIIENIEDEGIGEVVFRLLLTDD
ncbi:GNAT family N-acetyltransferase [Ruania zhangjianzhongii]|uniref:GNAT family N-acetyltransferase n=1 Tax=Ruania zhangjianzhongii TaxID=2603206 RepID=UPI0011C817E9|nr:GNAT family N-acetyltransferase [Ruania zhangjianzhongii]